MRLRSIGSLDGATRALVVVAGGVAFVDMVFYMALAPLLPRFVHTLGLSPTEAGLATASYAAGALAAIVPASLLAVRVGARVVVVVGLLLFAAACAVVAFAASFPMLVAGRIFQGVAGTCAWNCALAWLTQAAPEERRGELLGLVLSCALAGQLLGPVLGMVAAAVGLVPVFLSMAGLAALVGACAIRLPAPPVQPLRIAQLRGLAGSGLAWMGAWLIALHAIVAGALALLNPLRIDALGGGAAMIGAIYVLSAVAQLVIGPRAGRLSDRRARLTTVRWVLPGAVLGMLALALTLSVPPLVVVALVVPTGVLVALNWAPANAALIDVADRHAVPHAVVFALSGLAWSAGELVGASGAGLIADDGLAAAPYVLLAVLLAATWAAAMATRADLAPISR